MAPLRCVALVALCVYSVYRIVDVRLEKHLPECMLRQHVPWSDAAEIRDRERTTWLC